MAIQPTDFLGKTKKSAQDFAEARYMIFRLIKVDGESFFPYPDDSRADRVCVELEGGKVVKAVIQ